MSKKKCKNKNKLVEAERLYKRFEWKSLGVQWKLTEIIENTETEEWHEERFKNLGVLVFLKSL